MDVKNEVREFLIDLHGMLPRVGVCSKCGFSVMPGFTDASDRTPTIRIYRKDKLDPMCIFIGEVNYSISGDEIGGGKLMDLLNRVAIEIVCSNTRDDFETAFYEKY